MSSLQLVGTRHDAGRRARLSRTAWHGLCIWIHALAIVLFLGLDGGGYALASHGDAGIAVWWIIVALSALGLICTRRPNRAALAATLLLFGFIAWTALATLWSISSGRSLQDLALIVCYLGIFILALVVYDERRSATRHVIGALATAVTVIAVLALAARLWPHFIPTAAQTGQFLTGVRARLAWPLNYWNALAALMDFGLPLLLVVATSARSARAQMAAAAAIPVVALCAALTLSRDGVIAGAIAVIVFFLLAPDRLPRCATAISAGVGSAAVIAAAFHRRAVQQGQLGTAEHSQAISLLVIILLVCAAVAGVQYAIARTAWRMPRIRVPIRLAAWLSASAVVVLIVVALLAGAPHALVHAWHGFKSPKLSTAQSSVNRFGATSGEGRYQYWKVALESTAGHIFTGSGPGTFQLLWLPKAPFRSYVVNAHSLYIETFAEEGLIGLVLLVAFFAVIMATGVRRVLRSADKERVRAAGLVAALSGFLVFAAFDWIWQVAVLPAVFMLAAAALLASAGPETAPAPRTALSGRFRRISRPVGVLVGLGCIAALVVPLATTNAISMSQAAASGGNLIAALGDARQAVRVDPGSASAQLQVALVLEQARAFTAATVAARHAVSDEPSNWSNWLTLSRLEAEDGRAQAAVSAYDRARSLNPRSTLFSTSAETVSRLPGPSTFLTGFTDYNLTGAHPGLFSRAQAVGAGWVRLEANWRDIAPFLRPSGFDGADPASPGYDWTALDQAVRLATAHHLQIILEIDSAPDWAEGPNPPTSATLGAWEPDPAALGAFAHAVAERYSGHFTDPLHPNLELPKVTHFQIWDEPNLSTHLMPQWSAAKGGYAPASPALYRRMLNAAYENIKAVQPHSFVLSAGTAPYGDPPGGTRMYPVVFLRELLCLHGSRLAPEPCPDPAHLDALDHHPYSAKPDVPAALANDVSVVDLGKLKHIVAVARRLHRVLPNGPKPFWITEIDWPTTPPESRTADPDAISLGLQARYLSIAFYELWREGISHVLWYLVEDDLHIYGFGGAGIYFSDGRAKPAAAAFRFPFVAFDTSAGKVLVWGRAPSVGTVTIQRRMSGHWTSAGTLDTTLGGVFYGELRSLPKAVFRARIGTVSSVPFNSG